MVNILFIKGGGALMWSSYGSLATTTPMQDGLHISLRLNLVSPSTLVDQPEFRVCKSNLYIVVNKKK